MDTTIKCPCPGTPHQSDTVELRERLSFRERTTIQKALELIENDDTRGRAAEILATLSEFYLLMGVSGWTLVDDKGKPLEVNQRHIRDVLMEAEDVGTVVDAADDLYNKVILLPLLLRASASSPPTPTPSQEPEPSTSAPKELPSKHPRPSKPSSITTSPTAGTETTSLSLVGVSSSSLNSQSAA